MIISETLASIGRIELLESELKQIKAKLKAELALFKKNTKSVDHLKSCIDIVNTATVVAKVFDIRFEELISGKKARPLVTARCVVIEDALRKNHPPNAIAQVLNMHRTTVYNTHNHLTYQIKGITSLEEKVAEAREKLADKE